MTCVEKNVLVSATPETIWRIYLDVCNWNKWDPDTKSSVLDKGLTLGSRGVLVPARGQAVPMEVTSILDNAHFTVTSKTILFRLDFDHVLQQTGHGTRIVHRVNISGLIEPLLAWTLVPRIRKGLPATLLRLKALAEGIEAMPG